MKRLIQIIIIFFYRIYLRRRKHVSIHYNTFVNSLTEFEGYNKLGAQSVVSSSFIGMGTYMGRNNNLPFTRIGRFCCIATNVKVIIGTHPVNGFVSFHPAFFSPNRQAGFSFVDELYFNEHVKINDKLNCVIGNDVWVGEDVRIIAGVTIGDGALIAAGSLVTKDVKPYSIVGGVPAKLIRYWFSSKDINFLSDFKWWDKDLDWLRENADVMRDINELRAKYENSTRNN